jgi:hypothetical protein
MRNKDPRLIAFKAIMGNKSLSSIINDALLSPIGSTKRAKAKSILKSLNKKYDGQGGSSFDGKGGALDELSQNSPTNWLAQNTKLPEQQPPTYNQPENGMSSAYNEPMSETANKGTTFFSAAPSIKTSNNTDQGFSSRFNTPTALDEVYKNSPGNWLEQVKKINAEKKTTEEAPQGDQTYYTPTSFIENNGYDLEGWWGSLSEDEKKNKQFLYDSLKSGLGKDTFALMAISDKEKMKALFPGVPEDQLPVGATFMDQYADIEENLRNDYKLDTLESNLSRLQKNGVNIESDLNGYMTARDSYISKLDKMIDSANERSATVDMSNPADQKTMTNYMNYLYVMKGRQQKRYADFVKQAVDQYQVELDNAQNAYDATYKAFTTALSNKETMYKEDYNNFKKMLADMYDNVDNREKTIYDQLSLDDKLTSLLKDQADTALGGASIGSTLTDSQNTTAFSKFANASENKDKSSTELVKEWNSLDNAGKTKWLTYSNTSEEDWISELSGAVAKATAEAMKEGK